MGYTLSIGEAEIYWDEYGVNVRAKLVKHDSAPAFGDTRHQAHHGHFRIDDKLTECALYRATFI